MKISDNCRRYFIGLVVSAGSFACITQIIFAVTKFNFNVATEKCSDDLRQFWNGLAFIILSLIVGFIAHHIYWTWSESKKPFISTEEHKKQLEYTINDLNEKINTLESKESKTPEESKQLNKLKEDIAYCIKEYEKYKEPPNDILNKYRGGENAPKTKTT